MDTATSRSSRSWACRVDDSRRARALGEVGGEAGDDQRRAGVEEHDVAVGALLAVEHGAERLGVVRGVAALDGSAGRDGEAGVVGGDGEDA